MSLLDVLRSGIAVADIILKPLESDILLECYIGTDAYGSDTWAPPVSMKVACDWKAAEVTSAAGNITPSRATLTFIDIEAMKTATNGKGINVQDRITLPDGQAGPILLITGYTDPLTKIPVATEVYVGHTRLR